MHMGQDTSILNLLKEKEKEINDICRHIVCPPPEERKRERLIMEKERPPVSLWRLETVAGILLDEKTHAVRANHFKVNSKEIPLIQQYNVSIFKYLRDGNVAEADLSKEKDKRLNTAIIKSLYNKYTDLHNQGNIGVVFDGNSTLYSSKLLNLMIQGNTIENQISLQVELLESSQQFRVCLLHVATMRAPSTGGMFLLYIELFQLLCK